MSSALVRFIWRKWLRKELIMELLRMIQDIRNPILDVIFKLFTMCGEELVITVVICVLLWCVNKKHAYMIAFSFFGAGLVVQGLKITFRVDRPWIRDSRIVPVDGVVDTATSYSFPSGHTQAGTALFTCAAAILRRKWAMVASSIIIAGVMTSRMYLGVHTPADVLVSFVLTFVITGVVCAMYEKIEASGKKTKKIVAFTMAGICAGLIIYDLILLKMGVLVYDNAGDCFKAAGAGLGFCLGWYLETEYVNFDTKAVWWKQIIKLAVGLGVAVALKSVPKLIADNNMIIDVVRYFVTVLWILYLYPLILKKMAKKN